MSPRIPLLAILLLVPLSGRAQEAQLLETGVSITAAQETTTLDRETRRLKSSVMLTVTNTGPAPIEPPLHLVVGFSEANSADLGDLKVTGALGGIDAGPYQRHYFDCSDKAGGDGLAAGESFALTLAFDRPRGIVVSYRPELWGFVNQPPQVRSGGPYRGTVGQALALDASASSDPEGEELAFTWTLPDGTVLEGASVEAAFTEAGIQQVLLAIRDARGGTSVERVEIAVLPAGDFGIGRTRVLDGLGHPLDEVALSEEGPDGTRGSVLGDGGFASLGSSPGPYTWRFSKPGHLGVCRRATLEAGMVTVIPNPWMARLRTGGTPLSVLNESVFALADGSVRLRFPGGAFTRSGEGVITPLHGQALPGPLPPGWSPVVSFHLGLPQDPLEPGTVEIALAEDPPAGRGLVFARFDANTCEWLAGPAPAAIDGGVEIPVSRRGSFSLVLADGDPTAPGAAEAGQPLPGFGGGAELEGLSAEGGVTPREAVASLVPEEVTAQASVVFEAPAVLPSGTWFQGVVRETYQLSDGSSLAVPEFDQTYYAYRGMRGATGGVEARFPVRTTQLYGPEELNIARVGVSVCERQAFAGGVVGAEGGVLAAGEVLLALPGGAVVGPAAAGLRVVPTDDFLALIGDLGLVTAFALDLAELQPGSELAFGYAGEVSADAHFVLARHVNREGRSGLRPVLRLASDSSGALAAAEPASEPRLNGIRGSGTYLLLEVPGPMAVVQGRTLDPATRPLSGVAVSLVSAPWLCFSGSTGGYELVAAAGSGSLFGQDPASGDAAAAAFEVDASLAALEIDLTIGPAGPRVIATTPAAGATGVSRVTPVSVNFSEAVDPASFGADGVALRRADTGDAVPGSLSLSPGNQVATLLPTDPLDHSTGYVIEVAATLADPGGLPLEGERQFGFETAAAPARGEGAQLVIYEPGAENVPQEVLDDLVGYRPGIDTELVVAAGSQGTADPEVPVILANESTGATATVLSKPDGSFATFIEAAEEDFIAATFVNANGTRIRIPATRQLFDDGQVGLYRYGGILEAESDGGPVQVVIEPEAIGTRTKFKVETVDLATLLGLVQGTLPDQGQALGGLRFSYEGDDLTAPAEVVFPVDESSLDLEPGESPEERGFLLCEPIEFEGDTVYAVVDKMEFVRRGDGSSALMTASPPFPGLGATAAGTFLSVPIMMTLGTNLILTGKVVAGPEGQYSEAEILNGVSAGGVPLVRVAGAVVSGLTSTGASFESRGRLRPGAIVGRTNSAGFYALQIPYSPLEPTGVLAEARSFRFPGKIARTAIPGPPVGLGNIPVATANLLFGFGGASGSDTVAPLTYIRPPSAILPVGEVVTIPLDLIDDQTAPDLVEVTVNAMESLSLVPGEDFMSDDVELTELAAEVLGPTRKRIPLEIEAHRETLVVLDVKVTDAAGNLRESRFKLRFSAPPVDPGVDPAPADDEDETPPRVLGANPVHDTIFAGNRIDIYFSEPVKQMVSDPGSVAIVPAPPVEPVLELDETQQVLRIIASELMPAESYEVRVYLTSVEDLNGNYMEDDYVLNFRTPEYGQVGLSDIAGIRAATLHGSLSFELRNGGSGDEFLVVHRAGDTESTSAIGELGLPSFPRALTVVPDYSYRLEEGGAVFEDRLLVAVTGGLTGSGQIGPWLWIVDVSDPTSPRRVASTILTGDQATVATQLRWDAPYLATVINAFEQPGIAYINLQALIVGSQAAERGDSAALVPEYVPGADLNFDGDFVDAGESLPKPERASLFGQEFNVSMAPNLPGQSTSIVDFASLQRASAVVVAFRDRCQVVNWQGLPIGDGDVSIPDGRFADGGGSVRRLVVEQAFLFTDATGQRSFPAAIVGITDAGSSRIEVYDLSLPVSPELVRTLDIPATDSSSIMAMVSSGAGELTVGTGTRLYTIALELLGDETLADPANAITTVLDQGTAGRHLGANEIAFTTATGQLINRPPAIRVVQIPGRPVIDADALKALDPDEIRAHLADSSESPFLVPSFPGAECDGAMAGDDSPLEPADPLFHHYLRVTASGNLGDTFKISAEALVDAGYLETPRGEDHPPVILTAHAGQLGEVDDAQPDVEPVTLVRLSDDETSLLFNEYISSPFLVALRKLTPDQKALVGNVPGRMVMSSGFFMRFGFDKLDTADVDLDPYLSDIVGKDFLTGLNKTYRSIPPLYLESPNPSRYRGAPRIGGVDLQSGEFSSATVDLSVEGRHQDLIFERAYYSRAEFVGSLGPGWDFNWNARIVEFPRTVAPPSYRIPKVLKGGDECEEIRVTDALYIDGVGNTHVFREISDDNENTGLEPLYSSDPAIEEFLGSSGADKVAMYYESPAGVFTILLRLTDGSYMLVQPNGARSHFQPDGRLDRIVGVAQESVLQCRYRADGLLDEVEGDRGAVLQFGYYYPFLSVRRQGIDPPDENRAISGRLGRLRVSGGLISSLEVDFKYDDKGRLETVEYNSGKDLVYGYGSDPEKPNLLESIESEGGSGIPKQTISYDGDMIKTTKIGSRTLAFSGATYSLRERIDAGDNQEVSAAVMGSGGGEGSGVTYTLDANGSVSNFAGQDYEFREDMLPASFQSDSEDIVMTYDDGNAVHRFRGNVIKTERKAGDSSFVTETSYDASAFNRVDTVTDINGIETQYAYNGDDITVTKGPSVATLTRNEYHQQTSQKLDDQVGSFITSFEFLGAGPDTDLQTGEASALKQTMSRDSFGRLESYSSAGNTYTLQYDGGTGQLLNENPSDPGFPKISYGYDSMNRVDRHTVSVGSESIDQKFTYDSEFPGNIDTFTSQETGTAGAFTTDVDYEYNAGGLLEKVTQNGEETSYTYTGPIVTRVEGPALDREVTYTGKLVTEIVENGLTTQMGYDGAQRLDRVEGTGVKQEFGYKTSGGNETMLYETVTTTDEVTNASFTETYGYDGAGRVSSITCPGAGRTRSFEYFPDGQVAVFSINGEVMQKRDRDQTGRVTGATINQIVTSFSNFDPDTAQPQSEVTTFLNGSGTLNLSKTYDPSGNLRTVSDGVGTWRFDYDAFGNLVEREDPDGVTVTETFSPGGLPVTVTYADGTTATRTYNGELRIDTVNSANGTLDYDYDAEGLVRSVVYPDLSEDRYESRNDFFEAEQATIGGQLQNRAYTDYGKLESISSAGDQVSYTYDGHGRKLSAELGGNKVEWGYNDCGELDSETFLYGFLPGSPAWQANLNARGHLVTEDYPSGHTLSFGPDNFGEATTVGGAGVNSVSWLAPNLPNFVFFSDGLTLVYSYDGAMRLEGVEYKVGGEAGPTAAGFQYVLTPGGRVLSARKLHPGGFDVFGRNPVSEGMRVRDYRFGASDKEGSGPAAAVTGITFQHGEILSATASSTANPATGDIRGFFPDRSFQNQRLETLDGVTLAYDSAGSATSFPVWVRLPGATGLTRVIATAAYDGLGNLETIDRGDGVGIRYERDGTGRIVRRTVEGPAARCVPSDTCYLWKGNLPIEEYENTGSFAAPNWQLARRYLYLAGDLILVQVAPTPGGTLEDYVPIVGRNGSVGGYLRTDGTLVETIDYGAFGYPRFTDQTAAPSVLRSRSVVSNTVLFQGGWFDDASGLYQFGSRNLHPLAGTFLQRDDAPFALSLALYTAFNGDPVGVSDATGLVPDLGSRPDKKLKEIRSAAQDAYKSYNELSQAVYFKDKKDLDFAGKSVDFASKTLKLAGHFTEGAAQANVEHVAGELDNLKKGIDHLKTGIGVVKDLMALRENRELEDAVRASALSIRGTTASRSGWLQKLGAGAGPADLQNLSNKVKGSKDFKAATIVRGSQYAQGFYSDKKSAYSKERLGKIGSLAGGVGALSKLARETYFKDPKAKEDLVASQYLTAQEKVMDAVQKGATALKDFDAEKMRNAWKFGNWTDFSKQVKLRKTAIEASFTAGYEIGKLLVVALSDEDTGKAYMEQVKQFEKDGGFLTAIVGGGLATFGFDEAAFAVQNFSDWSLSDSLKNAIPIQGIMQEQQRQANRRQAYLNGLSAP